MTRAVIVTLPSFRPFACVVCGQRVTQCADVGTPERCGACVDAENLALHGTADPPPVGGLSWSGTTPGHWFEERPIPGWPGPPANFWMAEDEAERDMDRASHE